MENFSRELPMELVREVLARLPVKSLVRFRCVCKEWCSLISSPDFASLHLARYDNDHHNAPFLTANITGDGMLQWMLLSSQTYVDITGDNYVILNNKDIMDHINDFHERGGSVNGLLLLSKQSNDPLHGHWQRVLMLELMLWNPMIGKTHKLPSLCLHPGTRFGFGFSSSSNDYKVVAINAMDPKSSVQVYSLSTCTWRNIVDFEESIIWEIYSDGYLVVEGILVFLSVSSMEQNSYMVLFDVNDEVLTYIQLPFKGFCTYAIVYHEKVGVMDFDYEDNICNLWVMEKNWVPESWRKLYTIDILAGTFGMLCFKENGEFMLANEDGGVELYDVESGKVNTGRDCLPYRIVSCTPYRESLLLL